MDSMAARWISLFEELLNQKGISVSNSGSKDLPGVVRVAEPHA
jgi:hypothetical protein